MQEPHFFVGDMNNRICIKDFGLRLCIFSAVLLLLTGCAGLRSKSGEESKDMRLKP